jgi:hypothetical protein
MEVVIERACGMDIHKDNITACILTSKGKEIQTFSTKTVFLLFLENDRSFQLDLGLFLYSHYRRLVSRALPSQRLMYFGMFFLSTVSGNSLFALKVLLQNLSYFFVSAITQASIISYIFACSITI